MTFPLAGFALDPVDGTAIDGAQVRTYAIIDASHNVAGTHTDETSTNAIGRWEFPAVDPAASPTGQFAVRIQAEGKTFWVFPGVSMQMQSLIGMDGISAPLGQESVTNDLLAPNAVTNSKIANASVTENKLAFSLPDPITFREDLLDTGMQIPTSTTEILSVTPGRVGTWFAVVSYDVRLTQLSTFFGTVRRNTTSVTPGGARTQGPIQVVVTASFLVPITSVSQTINAVASVSSHSAQSTLGSGATRLQAFWLSP